MNIPIEKWTYSQRGDKGIAIRIGSLDIFFSYDTVIAFRDGNEFVVCENVWSTTTGAHLNSLDNGNKKARTPRNEFEKKLRLALIRHNLMQANNQDVVDQLEEVFQQ